MADNELSVITAASATKNLRARDISSASAHAQKVDVGPWTPTVAATADNQYAATAGSAVLTITVPTGFTHVLISVDGADVRMTEDGSAPTGSRGIFLADGFIGELAIPLLSGSPSPLKFIRDASTDANINISYRRYI